jgi:hypothetical protein
MTEVSENRKTKNGVRAFALSYLRFGSRFIFNKTLLLFLEVKLAFSRAAVALI